MSVADWLINLYACQHAVGVVLTVAPFHTAIDRLHPNQSLQETMIYDHGPSHAEVYAECFADEPTSIEPRKRLTLTYLTPDIRCIPNTAQSAFHAIHRVKPAGLEQER